MSRRTYTPIMRPGYVVDHGSTSRSPGRTIDWLQVDDEFKNEVGNKLILDGTIMVEVPGGQMIPKAASPGAALDPIGLLIGTAEENDPTAALSGWGLYTGGSFYKNLLADRERPTFDAWITELEEKPGLRFGFEEYHDSTDISQAYIPAAVVAPAPSAPPVGAPPSSGSPAASNKPVEKGGSK